MGVVRGTSACTSTGYSGDADSDSIARYYLPNTESHQKWYCATTYFRGICRSFEMTLDAVSRKGILW